MSSVVDDRMQISTRANCTVSIIVPIYNVAQYLDRCITSLISQTMSDIEVILVDDGSPDSSPQICDEWALRDSRIRVIHKQNQGLSAAYNSGVEAACGRYVLYVDGDDYIEPNTCEVLVSTAERERVDIVIFGSKTIYSSDDVEIYDPCYEVVSTAEALRRILAGGTLPAMSNMRLHTREIAQNVTFPVGKNYEDAATHVEFLSQTDRIAINLEPLYCYMRRPDSITTGAYRHKRSWDIVWAWEHTLEMIIQYYSGNTVLLAAAQSRVYKSYFAILDGMTIPGAVKDEQAKAKAVHYLRTHWLDIMRNPHVRYTRKIGMLVLKMSVNGYMKLAQRQYSRIQ